MRACTVIAASALAALSLVGPGGAQRDALTTFYHVRPDLRLCPSPLCGGVWVRRVNHRVTRCADGAARPACYAAAVRGAPRSVLDGAGGGLVRGRLVVGRAGALHGLGVLVVSAAWRPAGTADPVGTTFRVVDNGLRCVTHPCFSVSAFALETTRRRELSELDLASAGIAEAARRRTERALEAGGALVTGVVEVVPDAGPAGEGRRLVASQVWLPRSGP